MKNSMSLLRNESGWHKCIRMLSPIAIVIGSYRISSDGPAKEKLKELLFDWYNGALDKVAELQAQIDKLEELL